LLLIVDIIEYICYNKLSHKENIKRKTHMSTPTQLVPEVKFTKNGYEIRTEILGMAQGLVDAEYRSRFAGWELSVQRDPKTGHTVTNVEMPQYPGLDKVLETAEKLYGFVNKK
jgi:hypothetical protein